MKLYLHFNDVIINIKIWSDDTNDYFLVDIHNYEYINILRCRIN